MKKSTLLQLFFLTFSFALQAQQEIEYDLCNQDFRPIYMHPEKTQGKVYADTTASPEERAKDVISRLSFEEKLQLTGGWNKMHFHGISRLGIPPVYFSDASQGINIRNLCVKPEYSTAFPPAIALAATWNMPLVYDYAKSISEECRAWGVNVLLGPGVNMYRNSEGGRNYEYYGEDPYLTSRIAVSYVKGLQSLGTLATVKHFIGNEQEMARHVADVKIGERALHEIYLPPFKAAIEEAGALAVMDGNNLVNGFPGAANKPLIEGVLREKYGFNGIVMSDWANSVYWPDRLDLILDSGQSLLMSNNDLFAAYIKKEIEQHPEKKAQIEKGLEKMVFYNLYAFFKAGIYDRPYRDPDYVNRIETHKKVALQTAQEAITLLKNEGNILPLRPENVKKILVTGTEKALNVFTGKGSGSVGGYDHVSYLDGLKATFGNKIFYRTNPTETEIRSADVVLYFIEKPAGEGGDVPYRMPEVGPKVNTLSNYNKNLVVLYSGGNGLEMPWLRKVKGVVFNYLLGQEAGTALVNVLSGKVNPSGKLPFSIEKDFSDSPAHGYNILPNGKTYRKGTRGGSHDIYKEFGNLPIKYEEGIYIGYRWFEKKKIKPLFPFGFGLSYTSFKYGDLKLSSKNIKREKPVKVSFELKNTGTVDGAEVVQLYVYSPDAASDRPVKELKSFKKVFLKAGESKRVELSVNLKDLSFWSTEDHSWKTVHGIYTIGIGSSSADIKKKINIEFY